MNETFSLIIQWLMSGADFTSPGASIALGAIISALLIPGLSKIFDYLKTPFEGNAKFATVYVVSALLALAIGKITKSPMDIWQIMMTGGSAGLVAVGFHASKKQLTQTDEAAKDPE